MIESDRFETILRERLEKLKSFERDLVSEIWEQRNRYVKWPKEAHLLWPGETRKKLHSYPKSLVARLARKDIEVDYMAKLSNGPAIAAYRFADGYRPDKVDRKQGWPVHHIYNGRFAFPGTTKTLRAVEFGDHFTQSAGLVAAHPVAHTCGDEYFWFAWQLRREALKRFGYDPDGVFSLRLNKMGFKA